MSGDGASPSPNGELTAELHHRFASSEYGKTLADRVRWADYKPDHISQETWERMFGADVNNLDHLPLTHIQTRGFIRACHTPHADWEGPVPEAARFSDEQARTLEVVAITHDWGEAAEVVGDIMYHLKTDADEDREAIELEEIFIELLPDYRNLPELREVASVLADKQGETKLGAAFNTIERIGYVRTGLRAWERRSPDDVILNAELDFMSHFVFREHVPVLLQRAEIYPAADAFLRDRTESFVSLISGHQGRDSELVPLYEKHLKEGDPRHETFASDFSETAKRLFDRIPLTG